MRKTTGTDLNCVKRFIVISSAWVVSIPYTLTIELPSAPSQINRAIFSSFVGED